MFNTRRMTGVGCMESSRTAHWVTLQFPHLTAAEETVDLQCRPQWWNALLHVVIYFDQKKFFLHEKLACCSLDVPNISTVHLALLLGLQHVLPGGAGAAAAQSRTTGLFPHPVQHVEPQHQEETWENRTEPNQSFVFSSYFNFQDHWEGRDTFRVGLKYLQLLFLLQLITSF